MKYKLLVLDLDGTLTNSQKEITPFTREVLIEAQQQGLALALASGRPTYGIVPLADELQMARYGGYILSFNGGKIIDVKTQQVLFEQALPPDVIPTIYRRAHDAGVDLLSYKGQVIITENPRNKYIQYESFINKMPVRGVKEFVKALPLPADKCLAVGEPELLVPLEEQLHQELGMRINVYRSEPFFLELVPKGIDKANSLKVLRNRTKIPKEATIAMGDGFNDISMIRYAGLGVAMANAQPPVKAQADMVLPYTNDEEGVARFVREILPTL